MTDVIHNEKYYPNSLKYDRENGGKSIQDIAG